MFELRNKNTLVATFELTEGTYGDKATNIEVVGKLPYGCTVDRFSVWVKGRNATTHRKALRKYIEQSSLSSVKGFIKATHSISLNDTFWIKEDCEDLVWDNVSPYSNDFDAVIARCAFDGKLEGVSLSSVTPEFSTEGNYEKCWVREDDKVSMLKRGNVGTEPYNEYLASQVFFKLRAGIPYKLVYHHNKLASKCRLFTNALLGYVPYYKLNLPTDMDGVMSYMYSIGSEELLRRIIICDAITFNPDRHIGNFGIMVDNDSLEPKFMAPGFDYNLSLFPNAVEADFENVNLWIDRYRHKIEDFDFVGLARNMLTDDICSELKNLRGFEYEFDGDDVFSRKRVQYLTSLSNQQIDNILDMLVVPMFTSPRLERTSNISKYMDQFDMKEEEFIDNEDSLMDVLDVNDLRSLEKEISKLL